MTNNTSKFFITLKLKFIPPTRFLAFKKDKFEIRCNKKSPFCLTFDTLDEANNFIVKNKEYFIKTDYIEEVGVSSFNVKTS